MKQLVVFCTLILISAAASSSTYEQPLPINKAQLQSLDIEYFVKDKEIRTLATEEYEFISLLKEDSTGFPKGIAFIVPDVEQSIGHQAAVSAVYDELTNIGWTNMLITMPSPEIIAPEVNLWEQQQQLITQATTPDAEPIPDQNLTLKSFYSEDKYSSNYLETMEMAIEQRMVAAMEAAQSYPGFYLYICQGKSCTWLTNLIEQEKIEKPDALVMLSAHIPQQDLTDNFNMQVSKTEFPVLDLYRDQDSTWVVNHVKDRRKLARKSFKTNYRQRKLYYGIDYTSQRQRAVKEIYGFLTSVGM